LRLISKAKILDGGRRMSKIVGWNIFVEVEDDEGQLELVVWNISDYIAQQIDLEYQELLEEEE
jgi:hypothetical protein